jgi:hypothetical protein
MKTRVSVLAAACLAVWLTDTGRAHYGNGPRWNSGSIAMQLQLGSSSGSLVDGSTSWNAPAENSFSIWNTQLNGVSFAPVRNSTAANTSGNGINNVTFADDAYGDAFGAETLAITISWYRSSTNRYSEGDVVFNRKYSWNSYRGNLRSGTQDFQRVAIHEFGHVLGLGHPDQHGQSVTAIMNSRISNLDTIQTDDINGVRAVYGTPAAAPTTSDTLQANGRLLAGGSLTSTNRRYRLTYQNDGNLVLYDDSDRVALWASNTGDTSTGQVLLQGDGNLVVYDAGNVGRFATGTVGNTNARLLVQNDGNLVLYAANGQPVWDRFR